MAIRSTVRPPDRADTAPGFAPGKNMVWIPGGPFQMGSDEHYPEEAPAHRVSIDGFWMDIHQVTNAQFRRFVNATGYLTMAERAPVAQDYPGAIPELLVPGSIVFAQPSRPVGLDDHYRWWRWVPGADWRHPEGPGSNLGGRERHPVVHIAWEDASAFAAWAGESIPTEAEWEFACRGGLDGKVYAWGDELAPKGRMLANYWQGKFPWQNLATDGYERTAPVGSFPPNGYGLFDMIGNVWEWTADLYVDRRHQEGRCGDIPTTTTGAHCDTGIIPSAPRASIPCKVLKGGSFACAENYCRRYRPAARMHHPIDTGTCHIGFRCIVRPDKDAA
jgi:sulfatase modifying factor 1